MCAWVGADSVVEKRAGGGGAPSLPAWRLGTLLPTPLHSQPLPPPSIPPSLAQSHAPAPHRCALPSSSLHVLPSRCPVPPPHLIFFFSDARTHLSVRPQGMSVFLDTRGRDPYGTALTEVNEGVRNDLYHWILCRSVSRVPHARPPVHLNRSRLFFSLRVFPAQVGLGHGEFSGKAGKKGLGWGRTQVRGKKQTNRRFCHFFPEKKEEETPSVGPCWR